MTIRDLDEKIYRKAKSRAADEGKKMGDFVNEALQVQLARPKGKKAGKTFLDLFENPVDWGIKTNVAEEADDLIYW